MTRLLIVEDEPFVALEIEQVATEAGLSVAGILHTLPAALAFARTGDFEAAILDANLGGHSAEPIGLVLRERAIPYFVVSGYARDQLGPLVTGVSLLSQPFEVAALLREIEALCFAVEKKPV
jgi:DNA-binding response OmpR family regulator